MVYIFPSLKDMLRICMDMHAYAYGKGTPYCFLQQTTAHNEYGTIVAAWRFLMGSLAENI